MCGNIKICNYRSNMWFHENEKMGHMGLGAHKCNLWKYGFSNYVTMSKYLHNAQNVQMWTNTVFDGDSHIRSVTHVIYVNILYSRSCYLVHITVLFLILYYFGHLGSKQTVPFFNLAIGNVCLSPHTEILTYASRVPCHNNDGYVFVVFHGVLTYKTAQ